MTVLWRSKALAAVLVAALLAAGFGYWNHAAREKRELRDAVTTIVRDTGSRLRQALALEVSLPQVGRVGTGTQLEEQAAAVDERLQQLKSMDANVEPALLAVAVSYVLTARELLRLQASSNRHRQLLTLTLDALRKHMQSDDRTGAWVADAVAAQERVNKDYRDYRIATEAFVAVLDTLRAAQAKLVPHLDTAELPEQQLIGEARKQMLEGVAEAAAEVEKLGRLEAYR